MERVNHEHKTEDGSPVFTPKAGHPVLDLPHESQHEDDHQERSPTERAAILQSISEQLMVAYAQECPELQEEIGMATSHLLALSKHLTERSQWHLHPQSRQGVSMHMPEYPMGTDELLGAI